MSNQVVSRAMLSASGFPVPFSIRDKVEAETLVWSATSRRLSFKLLAAPANRAPKFFGID